LNFNIPNRVQRLIINEMPPHNLYLEPFLRSNSVLQWKRKARSNIGVSQDPEVVTAAISQFRSRGYLICGDDAIAFLKSYRWLHSEGAELVYCNPPGIDKTNQRESAASYHQYLLDTLKTLPCMVMITGTWSKLYEHELSSWRSITYMGIDGVQEFLWMNFQKSFALHDYRFVGADFREREQLKKKAARWRERLADMPPLERYALLNALHEFTA